RIGDLSAEYLVSRGRRASDGVRIRNASARFRRLGFLVAGFLEVSRELPVKPGQILKRGLELPIRGARGARLEFGRLAPAFGEIGHCVARAFRRAIMPERPAIASGPARSAQGRAGIEPSARSGASGAHAALATRTPAPSSSITLLSSLTQA